MRTPILTPLLALLVMAWPGRSAPQAPPGPAAPPQAQASPLLKPLPARWRAQPPAPDLAFEPQPKPVTGWGWRADVRGHPFELQLPPPDSAPDRDARAEDTLVGWGWRDESSSLLVGYGQHAVGPAPPPAWPAWKDDAARWRNTGAFGLTVSIK